MNFVAEPEPNRRWHRRCWFFHLRKEALHTFLGVGVDVIAIIKDPDIVFGGEGRDIYIYIYLYNIMGYGHPKVRI